MPFPQFSFYALFLFYLSLNFICHPLLYVLFFYISFPLRISRFICLLLPVFSYIFLSWTLSLILPHAIPSPFPIFTLLSSSSPHLALLFSITSSYPTSLFIQRFLKVRFTLFIISLSFPFVHIKCSSPLYIFVLFIFFSSYYSFPPNRLPASLSLHSFCSSLSSYVLSST
jgi:hypothetical protein